MSCRPFFGEPWPAPVCEQGSMVPTPVGELCGLCVEPIEPDHQGVYEDGRPQHRECTLRKAVGGIGHLTDHLFWCMNMRKPDAGLSYRESALAVWSHVDRNGLRAPGRGIIRAR